MTTKKIGQIGNVLGIKLIDSVIVNADGECQSIRKYLMEKENENEVE